MNKIKEIREGAGISQSKLYCKLGWSQTRLSNYEQGIRKVGLNEARAVVSALNMMGVQCTLDDVFPPITPQPNKNGADSRDGHQG